MKPSDITLYRPQGKPMALTRALAKELKNLGQDKVPATLLLDLLLLLGRHSFNGYVLSLETAAEQAVLLLVNYANVENKGSAQSLARISFTVDKAASISYDVAAAASKQDTAVVEQLAIGLGLEFFKENAPRMQAAQPLEAVQLLTPEQLDQALAMVQARLQELQVKQQAQQREANILINRLEYKIKETSKAVEQAQRQLDERNKSIAATAVIQETAADVAANSYTKELQRRLGRDKICLVGGLQTGQRKLQQLLPNLMLIDNKNFDPAKLQDARLLIINTHEIGHAVTRKAVAIALARNIQVHYTSRNNLEALAQALLLQLE